jgi:hypothetical protein
MWKWYRDAKVCYAYLVDVPDHLPAPSPALDDAVKKSRYFTRAWTMQELVTPKELIFYTQGWINIGTRSQWALFMSTFTGIHQKALEGAIVAVKSFSVAQKMSWASTRSATRPEDIAYCLLGLFDVNMPLLYGEGGTKAFIRLQEEIMKDSDDHTLFAWEPDSTGLDGQEEGGEIVPSAVDLVGLLASHPGLFRRSGDIRYFRRWDESFPYSMTNKGLQITLPLVYEKGDEFLTAVLDCYRETPSDNKENTRCPLAVQLAKLRGDQYARVERTLSECPIVAIIEISQTRRTVFIRKNILVPEGAYSLDPNRVIAFTVTCHASHYIIQSHGQGT